MLQRLQAHRGEVSALHYCAEDLIVISVGWDRCIRISDEEAPDGQLMREVQNAHDADILCVDYSYELGIFATGCRKGELKVWDFQLVNLDAVLLGHESAVMSVAFVPGHPLMISADAMGVVMLWAVRPSVMRYAWVLCDVMQGCALVTAVCCVCRYKLMAKWRNAFLGAPSGPNLAAGKSSLSPSHALSGTFGDFGDNDESARVPTESVTSIAITASSGSKGTPRMLRLSPSPAAVCRMCDACRCANIHFILWKR